jgi:N-terminal domain of toast_rack, DUF2154
MKRLVVLLVVAPVFLGSCGAQGQGVGELRSESQAVDPENAQSVVAELRMGADELKATGGADALIEADFAYNVADWQPEVSGETDELSVEQGSGEDAPFGGDARNEWDLRFNDDVPLDLSVEMGAGESDLDLDSLALTGLNLAMGAGVTTVDLTGDYEQNLAANIEGGLGEAAVLLPSEVGVRVNAQGGLGQINAEGLRSEGEAYVNDAYGDSDVTLEVDVRGGIGEINLEVV